MMRSSVGLALIARDEEAALPALLGSISGCFDEVALLDTGSTDGTIAVFEAWAAREEHADPGFSARLAERPWDDDFAAARNAADAMLGTDWRAWADADDELRGAARLRAIAAAAPPGIAAFVADYDIGGARGRAARIRMWRAGAGRWQWPVHEQVVVTGELAAIPSGDVVWRHRGADEPDSGRNLRILHRWLEREPGNRRALAHAGREEAGRGNHERAVELLGRFVAASTGWDDERAQVHRHRALSLMALGRLDEAAADAAAVAAAMPEWPDSYLTLAEVALARGDAETAIAHANRVLELGPPRTALLHAPADYTVRPLALLARAGAAHA